MYHPFFGCVWFVVFILVVGYPAWKIAEKMGYPGPMSLLIYIPIVNLIVLWYLALNEWPAENELRRWRAYAPAVTPVVPPPPPPPPPVAP